MRVLLFGTYDEQRHPRVRVLREGLVAAGLEVEVLNHPVEDSTSARLQAAAHPGAAFRWLRSLLRSWARLIADSMHAPKPDAIVVGYLGVLDVVLARLRWPRRTIVLDHMAPLRGIALDRELGGAARTVFTLADRLAESIADVILFDTPQHATMSRAPSAKKLVVPVGAAGDWFEVAGRPRQPGEPLSVVFFGLFTPLQGTPTIGRSIRLLRDRAIRFTMIGSGQDYEACRNEADQAPNATWLDWVASDELPGLVASHHVCLGIVGSTTKASRVVPNKVFQGAAAGCALVTLDSEAQRSVLADAAIYVPAGDAEALATAISTLADDPTALEDARHRARARANEWEPAAIVKPLVLELCRRRGCG